MKVPFYRLTASILLIAVGVLIWLTNLGIVDIAWQRDWPAILIIVGLIELVKHLFRKNVRHG